MAQLRRKTVLITGASGGMGKTIARRMGATMNLILTDLAAGPLEQFGTDLKNEGYVVAATVAGDLAEPSVLSHLAQAVNDQEGLDVLVHTQAYHLLKPPGARSSTSTPSPLNAWLRR